MRYRPVERSRRCLINEYVFPFSRSILSLTCRFFSYSVRHSSHRLTASYIDC